MGSNQSETLRVVSMVIIRGAHEDCLEDQRPTGPRYTRDTLRSLLQLLGCKPRHAYKIMQAIFAAVEVAVVSSRQQRTARRTFQVYPPGASRVHVSLSRTDFNDLLSASAAQYSYKISATSDELKVACGLRERRRCVIILLCGTSGSGKSTLASILATRLGITTVISTDSIRHMLRSFQPKEEAPLLWASTYQAGEALGLPGERPGESEAACETKPDRTISGYKAQCELLMEHLHVLITRCEAQCQSLICEGVHLSINFVLKLMSAHPSVLPFLVYIKNEGKHVERMAVRAKYMTLDPNMNRYVRYMANIRCIQEYLVRKADKHQVPKVENTNIDRSVGVIHLSIMGCLRRMMRGESVLDPGTGVCRMLALEYQGVLNHLHAASVTGLEKAAGGGGSSGSQPTASSILPPWEAPSATGSDEPAGPAAAGAGTAAAAADTSSSSISAQPPGVAAGQGLHMQGLTVVTPEMGTAAAAWRAGGGGPDLGQQQQQLQGRLSEVGVEAGLCHTSTTYLPEPSKSAAAAAVGAPSGTNSSPERLLSPFQLQQQGGCHVGAATAAAVCGSSTLQQEADPQGGEVLGGSSQGGRNQHVPSSCTPNSTSSSTACVYPVVEDGVGGSGGGGGSSRDVGGGELVSPVVRGGGSGWPTAADAGAQAGAAEAAGAGAGAADAAGAGTGAADAAGAGTGAANAAGATVATGEGASVAGLRVLRKSEPADVPLAASLASLLLRGQLGADGAGSPGVSWEELLQSSVLSPGEVSPPSPLAADGLRMKYMRGPDRQYNGHSRGYSHRAGGGAASPAAAAAAAGGEGSSSYGAGPASSAAGGGCSSGGGGSPRALTVATAGGGSGRSSLEGYALHEGGSSYSSSPYSWQQQGLLEEERGDLMAGGLVSSGDEGLLEEVEGESSGDGSEGGRFLQEYGSMCESTTCDEHDEEEGLGLRAWNAGMARALWPNNSRGSSQNSSGVLPAHVIPAGAAAAAGGGGGGGAAASGGAGVPAQPGAGAWGSTSAGSASGGHGSKSWQTSGSWKLQGVLRPPEAAAGGGATSAAAAAVAVGAVSVSSGSKPLLGGR